MVKSFVLEGSSTETALIRMAIHAGVDIAELRKQYPLLKTNYRSESRLFMGTLHRAENHQVLVALKGSPLEVLEMCDRHIKGNEELPLTEEDRSRIETENEHMAGEALRVPRVRPFHRPRR